MGRQNTSTKFVRIEVDAPKIRGGLTGFLDVEDPSLLTKIPAFTERREESQRATEHDKPLADPGVRETPTKDNSSHAVGLGEENSLATDSRGPPAKGLGVVHLTL
ncbi:hypothetical protein PRK78_002786 [Emydomyces testavorans]|uniref:Uncharacterized protein n=1 Tax=Emydomyces testavorans TaxID=2070801 RepID=A0AAF0DH05_9EURO|nr:hypothetical protein PRK78_002786 [Emydomyces testavorans]